jgi:hypothetical protein
MQKWYRHRIGIPSNFVNGYFTLEYTSPTGLHSGNTISHHYPLYKASKQPEIVKGCEDLYSVGCMNDGVIPISKHGERISVINGSGKTLFTLDPIDGKEIVSCDIAFYDGMLRIKNEDNKYGFVDKKGNAVIKPQYHKVFPFSEGKALVEDFKVGSVTGKYFAKYSVIDTKGNVISSWEDCGRTTPEFFGYNLFPDWGAVIEGVGRYHDGMLLVENNDRRFLFLDAKGNTKFTTPTEVKSVTEYNSKCYVCKFNGGCGVMDFKGNVIIPGQHKCVILLRNGNILCDEDEHLRYKETFHLYDSSGREKSKIECVCLRVYGNFIIASIETIQNNRTVLKHTLLDNELKPIAEFDDFYANFLTEHGDLEVTSSYIEYQKL